MAGLEVVAAVLVRDGRALACRRAAHKSGAGTWEFPGGKVEPGEAPERALAREIREELGVDVTVGALVDRSEVPTGAGAIDLACYLADPVGALPTSSTDHDELRWVPLADLGDLTWSAPDLPAVRRLVHRARHPDADWLIDPAAAAPAHAPSRDEHLARLAELSDAHARAVAELRAGVRAAHADGVDEHRIAASARLSLADVRALLG